jgi:hypothetical protein
MRLERWVNGLVGCSGGTLARHWIELLAAKASTSRSLDVAPRISDTASRMKDTDPTSVGETWSGF